MESISKEEIIEALKCAKEIAQHNTQLINEKKDKDEIISLLKEKIERLENENIGLQQQRKK